VVSKYHFDLCLLFPPRGQGASCSAYFRLFPPAFPRAGKGKLHKRSSVCKNCNNRKRIAPFCAFHLRELYFSVHNLLQRELYACRVVRYAWFTSDK